MKNFRKAALAIATASTVALGSTAVASADQVNLTGPKKDEKAVSQTLGSDQGISGKDGFGLTQTTDQPGWWILTKTLTYGAFVGVIASVGIAIGNYLKNQGIII